MSELNKENIDSSCNQQRDKQSYTNSCTVEQQFTGAEENLPKKLQPPKSRLPLFRGFFRETRPDSIKLVKSASFQNDHYQQNVQIKCKNNYQKNMQFNYRLAGKSQSAETAEKNKIKSKIPKSTSCMQMKSICQQQKDVFSIGSFSPRIEKRAGSISPCVVPKLKLGQFQLYSPLTPRTRNVSSNSSRHSFMLPQSTGKPHYDRLHSGFKSDQFSTSSTPSSTPRACRCRSWANSVSSSPVLPVSNCSSFYSTTPLKRHVKKILNHEANGLTIRIPRKMSEPPHSSAQTNTLERTRATSTVTQPARTTDSPFPGSSVVKSKSLTTSMDKLAVSSKGNNEGSASSSRESSRPCSRGSTPSSNKSPTIPSSSRRSTPARSPKTPERKVSNRFTPERKTPDRRSCDRVTPERKSPSRNTPERRTSNRVTPDRFCSRRSPEKTTLASNIRRKDGVVAMRDEEQKAHSKSPSGSEISLNSAHSVTSTESSKSQKSAKSSSPGLLNGKDEVKSKPSTSESKGSAVPTRSSSSLSELSSRVIGSTKPNPVMKRSSTSVLTNGESQEATNKLDDIMNTENSNSRQSTPRQTPSRSSNYQRHSIGSTMGKKSLPVFSSYISLFQVQEKLKKGEVIEGVLRINPKNYEDAYISAPDGGMDIYIGGVHDRHGALNKDVVVVQVYPPSKWKEIALRADFRSLCVFTIDPSTARDLDDAISCVPLANGNFQVGVHIADVAYFVKENSLLDRLASERATSIYLIDRVIPMLPRILCDRLCSLVPGEDRLTFSVIWEMTLKGNIVSEQIVRSIICSCTQLSYEHAQLIIENSEKPIKPSELPTIASPFTPHLIRQSISTLHQIAVCLRNRRFENGALHLNQVKLQFGLDSETKKPSSFQAYQYKDSNFMIEELMLLANITVAHKINTVFPSQAILRCHPQPHKYVLHRTADLLRNYNVHLDITSSKSFHFSLLKYKAVDKESSARLQAIISLCSKPMQLARYFCAGLIEDISMFHHYALNVPLYTHFTSPIRRYADILVHRLLAAVVEPFRSKPPYLSLVQLKQKADICNDMKQISKEIQDIHGEYYVTLFIQQVGELVEEAVVVGILDHSFDVLLIRIGIVKRVYLDKLPLESFKLNRTGNVAQLDLQWKSLSSLPSILQVIHLFNIVKVFLKPESISLRFSATLIRPD